MPAPWDGNGKMIESFKKERDVLRARCEKLEAVLEALFEEMNEYSYMYDEALEALKGEK